MIELSFDDNRVAQAVVDSAFAVHSALGPGLLEVAYEQCLGCELKIRGVAFERQVGVAFVHRGERIEGAYRMDLLVEERIVVEVKATESSLPLHQAQLLTLSQAFGPPARRPDQLQCSANSKRHQTPCEISIAARNIKRKDAKDTRKGANEPAH